MPTQLIDSNYSLELADDVLLVDTTTGAVVVTLPASSPVGKRYTVKHVSGTNPLTVAPAAGQVDGQPSFPYTIAKQAAIFHSDSSNWHVV